MIGGMLERLGGGSNGVGRGGEAGREPTASNGSVPLTRPPPPPPPASRSPVSPSPVGPSITHYDETTGVPLAREAVASQQALGHTVVPLSEAYSRRLSRLQVLYCTYDLSLAFSVVCAVALSTRRESPAVSPSPHRKPAAPIDFHPKRQLLPASLFVNIYGTPEFGVEQANAGAGEASAAQAAVSGAKRGSSGGEGCDRAGDARRRERDRGEAEVRRGPQAGATFCLYVLP